MSLGIGRNTLTLLSASVIQKATAFVYFALIARWAGVEDTGKYFFALSWALLFSVLTDAGLTPVLIRETAKDPEHAKKYLNQVFTLKIPLTILTVGIVIGGIYLLDYPPITRQMVALAAIVLSLDAISLTFYGFLRGHHMLKFEALGLVLSQLISFSFGIWVLLTGQPLQLLIVALVLGSAYNAAQAVFFTYRKLRIRPSLVWDTPFIKSIFKAAIPFALAGAFVKIYNSVDTVLLSSFIGDEAVGLYSVPFKLTFAFQFVPMAFTAALYPAMSRYWATDRDHLGRVLYKAMKYLSILVMPLVVGAVVLGQDIIFAIYGPAYGPSVLALQILIVTLISVFLDFPLGSVLNASDRQIIQTKLMGLAMLVSIGLNLLLIPHMSFLGAVIASLVSHFVLFVGGIFAVNRFLKWPFEKFLLDWLRITAAALGMGFLVWYTKSALPLPVSIFFGVVTYFFLGLAFRGFGPKQIMEVFTAVFRRNKSV